MPFHFDLIIVYHNISILLLVLPVASVYSNITIESQAYVSEFETSNAGHFYFF
jgi:hypothetical protein